MTGQELRDHLRATLNDERVRGLAAKYGVQLRERRLIVFELVVALILCGGTHEGGRQYDVLRTYVENGAPRVRRGTLNEAASRRLRSARRAVITAGPDDLA
jgi:hypothetical protein